MKTIFFRQARLVFALVFLLLTGWAAGTAKAGGPMCVDAGWVISNSGANNLTQTQASNYVAGKTGWLRVEFRLVNGNTAWNSAMLGYYDTAINIARTNGLQILALIDNTSWNGGQSAWCANSHEINPGSNGDNSYVDGFAAGAVQPIIQHFHDRIKVYEIWNEPSTWSTSSTNGGVVSYSGATYVYPSNFGWMLAKSWIAAHITLGYSDVKVISGGIFGTSALGASDPGGNSASNYLDAVYSQGTNVAVGSFSSAKSSYGSYPLDGIGQHLYIDYNVATTSADIQQYLDLIRGAYTKYEGANTAKKTYLTEFGWSTANVSQQTQANNLATAFIVIEAANSYVALASWFNWEDSPAANLYFGVFDQNGAAKTAYQQYQFYQEYEGYYTNGTVNTNIQNYFNALGQAAIGDAFDNGSSAFVHNLSGGGYTASAQDFAGGAHQNLTLFITNGTTPWFMSPICVPFDNTNYDTQYGGSHDMDVQTPLGTPITSIVSGTVSSLTQPTWGWQIGIQLDQAINNAPYFAYLHLGAVKPGLAVGQHVALGELIAYSGGANSTAQLGSNTNTPFGPQFIDAPAQSSQPQTGMALMRGPEYGVGAGWTTLPDPALDPTPTLLAAQSNYLAGISAYEVNDLHGLWTYYNSHGGMAAFGPPLNNEYTSGSGTRQDFATASITWNSANGVVTNTAFLNLPAAFTGGAILVTTNSATMTGMVLPNGTNTLAWCQWGTNLNYGQTTSAFNVGSGFQVIPVNSLINGLAGGMIYHYRLVASNAVGMAVGGDRQFKTGGRVKAWGDDTLGQTNLPAGLTNVVGIASGEYYGLALKTDGTVQGWGNNNWGQANVPTNLAGVVGIAAGALHSLALKANGTVTAWGGNNFGQTSVPSGLSNVVAIAAGAYHSLALQSNGSVVLWGSYTSGSTNLPASVTNVAAVAGGINHSLALRVDGTVVAWGDNTYGQTNVPVTLSNAVQISSGDYHGLALRGDGTVMAWGRNNVGQTNIPAGLSNVLAIACGDNYNMALRADGVVIAWGDNSHGETNPLAGLTNVSAVAGGYYSGYAIGNLPPRANGQTLSGFVNHDLPIALTASAGDGGSLSYRIVGLPVAGTLYQASGGSRGSLVNLTNTVVSDPGGNIIFAPGLNGLGTPYSSFGFVANDGLNDSAVAQVTVNLMLPMIPQIGKLAMVGGTPQGFELNFAGSSNAVYSVWVSTNLTTWQRIGSATEASAGQYQYVDAPTTNWPARFYRISAP